MKSVAVHGKPRRSCMTGAIGGETQRRDVYMDTMKSPAIHG